MLHSVCIDASGSIQVCLHILLPSAAYMQLGTLCAPGVPHLIMFLMLTSQLSLR
jgi:hypothetical protein